MIKNAKTSEEALNVIGAKKIEPYSLVNNYGYTFKIGNRKYDIRYWANCYGVALNRWETMKCDKRKRDDVINELLKETGFETVDELYYHEYHDNNGFGLYGLDLGWVWVKTYNAEQNREWILDNGKYDNMVWGINCPYDSQSTTIKKIQIDKALKDMKLNDNYYSYVRLD